MNDPVAEKELGTDRTVAFTTVTTGFFVSPSLVEMGPLCGGPGQAVIDKTIMDIAA
jgi:hypothetical protein